MQLRPRGSLVRVALLAVALNVLPAPMVHAQDPGEALDDALCMLWSPEEVAAVIGGAVQPTPDFGTCYWMPSDAAGEWLLVSASWSDSTLDEQRAIPLDGHEVAVGSLIGWYEEISGNLYLPFADGLLSIMVGAAAPGVDPEAAAVTLGELALSRPASLPAPPTPTSTTPPTNDPDLESMLPETVGGERLRGYSFAGANHFASSPAEALQPLTYAVSAVGKTLEDVSVVYASTPDARIWVDAIRIRGADVAAVLPFLIDYWFARMGLTPEPGSVGGKAVTVMSSSEGGSWYVYPHGDTMWTVRADEPRLSEILAALP